MSFFPARGLEHRERKPEHDERVVDTSDPDREVATAASRRGIYTVLQIVMN